MRYGAELRGTLMAAVVLVCPVAVCAEDDEDPGRGVARISVINGDVSVRRGDSGDWVAAAVNAPLVVEDTVAAGPGSRAEVQFDYANMLRLASNAEVKITELEHRRYQVQVARGTVDFRVLRESDADVDVNTPAVSVRPARKGRYRITVRDDGQVEVTARSGQVEVYTPRGVERLGSGQTMLVRGQPDGPEYQMTGAVPRDEFDRWSEQRDRALERSGSYRHVHRSIYGADDLDGAGRWIYDPAYGWVWVPHVGPGWAPYRHGRWAWQDWYGWTWISYEPWGWAPYHWGRWYHHHHWGWSWYPGPIHRVHYWRPALVAFFGFGSVNVGVGFGSFGWVPLAPYEPYYPWYGRRYYGAYRNSTYIDRSVHVTKVNITNVYRNARVRSAISTVDASGFGRGNSVVRVHNGEVRQAALVRGQLPVAPSADSLRFTNAEPRYRGRGDTGTRYFRRREPAPVERVSFAEQQRSFRAAGEPRMRNEAAARESAVARRSAAPEGAAGADARQGRGWRRIGEPAASGSAEVPGAGTATRATSWRRAGERSADGADGQVRSTESLGRSGNWRRFGEQPPATTSAGSLNVDSAGRVRRSEPADRTGSWRRFGEQPQATPSVGAGSPEEPGRVRRSEPAGRTGSWRRFGEQPQATPSVGAGSPEEPGRVRRSEPAGRTGSWRRLGEQPSATQSVGAAGAGEPARVRRSEPADRTGSWRRLGEQPASSGAWRRFGDPSGAGTSRDARPAGVSGRTWQNFGAPGVATGVQPDRGDAAERVRRGAERDGRASQWQTQREPRSFGRFSGAESIRIAPPVVRERQAPHVDSGSRVYRQGGAPGGGRVSRGQGARSGGRTR